MDNNNWISVEEKLPDMIEGKTYSENVLVFCDGEVMVMAFGYMDFDDDGGYGWSNCYGDINGDPEYDADYHPTHWQPIPKPPTKH